MTKVTIKFDDTKILKSCVNSLLTEAIDTAKSIIAQGESNRAEIQHDGIVLATVKVKRKEPQEI